VIAKRTLEGRPRLAARLICLQSWLSRHEVRVPQIPKHGRHHQIANRKAVVQVIAIAESIRELCKPQLDPLLHVRATKHCPFLIGAEEIDSGKSIDLNLHRVERREQPGDRARPRLLINRKERLTPRPNVEHYRAGFEQDEIILFENRHLSERLTRAIFGGRLVVGVNQPRTVCEAGLFERPPHAEIAY